MLSLSQTALELTEAQQADVMYMRLLFHARVEALLQEKKEFLQPFSAGVAETSPDASTRLGDVALLAELLY